MTIRAANAKSGRSRVVPLTADLLTTLREVEDRHSIRAMDGCDPVFCLADGTRITYPMLRVAWAAVRGATKGAIPGAERASLRFHDLRHTAASLMVAAGVPLFDLSKLLGHSTIQMTMRYAHFSPENARASVERFGRAVALLPKSVADAAAV